MERYLEVKYGSRFERTVENGRKGDGGKDGYIYDIKQYFAISSREDLKTKIKYDYFNCVKKNRDIKIFTYITNTPLPSDHAEIINTLRDHNPDITIEILTHYTIAAEISDFPTHHIEKILNRSLSHSRDNSVYFMEREIENFSFREAIRDSNHWYVLMVIIFLYVGLNFYFTGFTDLAISISMMVFFLVFTGYLILFGKGIRKTKFPHKILYLICTGKLPVSEEILFTDLANKTILRNSDWDFTFHKRNTDCIKKGCNGKVYLCASDGGMTIGRCEKDPINHTYTVDKNFYGNLIL